MEKLEVIRRHGWHGLLCCAFCVVRFAPDVHPTVQTRSSWQSPRVSLEGVGGNVTRYACHLDRFCTSKPWRCRCVFLDGVVGVTQHAFIPPETDSPRKGPEQSRCVVALLDPARLLSFSLCFFYVFHCFVFPFFILTLSISPCFSAVMRICFLSFSLHFSSLFLSFFKLSFFFSFIF